MNRNLSKAILATVAALGAAPAAWAQYDPNCWPTTGGGFSTDYNLYTLSNLLFGTSVGISGSTGYNANNAVHDGRCGNDVQANHGRFGFEIGSTGSVQSTLDDSLTLTFGMPNTTGNSNGFAVIVTGTGVPWTETVFGDSGIGTAFYGASDRYFVVESAAGNVDTTLRVDVIGDAAKYTWNLKNTDTKADLIGMMVGSWVQPASLVPFDAHIDYVYAQGYKPFLTEQAFHLSDNTSLFPNTMTFALNQQDAYGLQVINSPLVAPNSEGINAPDQTQVDDFVIGQYLSVLGVSYPPHVPSTKPPYPYLVNTDVPFVEVPSSLEQGIVGIPFDRASFLQFWFPKTVAAGNTRTITAYYRSTWGVSDYQAPFAAVVDTPKTINTDPTNPSTYTNSTFTFRVYVDNVGGYASSGKTVDLHNVRISVNLPQGFVDASNPTGPSAGKLSGYIPTVTAGAVAFKDFSVNVTSTVSPGPQSYSVAINTDTGASKALTGTINVAGTPTLAIRQNANLVGVPWVFSASDWGTVLGLTPNSDFQAFTWDASLNQYVVQPNAQRGQGVFVISAADHGTLTLGGSPQQASNTTPPVVDVSTYIGTSIASIQDIISESSDVALLLKPGWNLVANPFNYSISLGQLLGIDSGTPTKVLTFSQLVQANLISPSFAYYNPDSQGYNYISTNTDILLPNTGYWVYVTSPANVDLVFPKVLTPFVSIRGSSTGWAQSEKQWKLQLVARNNKSVDSQNFVGVASAAVSRSLTTRKPPIAPLPTAVSLTVKDTVNGKPVGLAQSLRSTGGNTQAWDIEVTSKSAGPVTVTWPNMATVPSDVQFRLTDVSTGATRDLRRGSGYTFTASEGSVRALKVEAVPGTASKAVIANVTASQSRGIGGSVVVNYVLAADATVSVRVLSNGRAIYQSVAGRADHAGSNAATWNLRDAANRQVAPGLYTIEVTAEGADGQRVHRTIPVTVTR